MSILFCIKPETFKAVEGAYWASNPEMLKNQKRVLNVDCAKNDTAAFQFQICCDEDYIVNLTDTPYFSSKGNIQSVRVDFPSGWKLSFCIMHPCDDRFFRADGLDFCGIKEFKKNQTCTIYAEYVIPKDQKTGKKDYIFTLKSSNKFTDEKNAGSLKLSVNVHDFVMPDKKKFKFHLDLWQHNSSVSRAYHVPLWSDEHFEILENYVASLAALGQKSVTIIASDAPWSGQWCHFEYRNNANLYEYSIIAAKKKANGKFEYDYTKMQRYIDLCKKYSISKDISVFGLINVWCDEAGGFKKLAKDYPDGPKIRYFDEKTSSYKYMKKASEIDDYIKNLEKYFIKTKQIDKVRLVADEPADVVKYKASIDHIKKIAPHFILKAALNHSDFIPEFGNRVNDFAPSLLTWSKEHLKIAEYQKTMPDKNFLWYVCNNPKNPNTFLASNLTETLFMGVLTAYFKMDGFLRWNYTVWCEDPIKDNRYFPWACGDLHFVYPAPNGKPMLTLRYKALKRAIELCELINILRKQKGDKAASKCFDMVIKFKDVCDLFVNDEPIPIEKMCSVEYSDYNKMKAYILSSLEEK